MSSGRDKAFRSWTKLLNPEELRTNLIRASVFLTSYELMNQALIDPLEGFFSDGFNADGPILGEKYRCKVLSLHAMPFLASVLWFRNMGAIDDADVQRIREIRDHRNFVAHRIPEVLASFDSEVRTDLLRATVEVVKKVDVWWLREIEIPTNPDFDAIAPDEMDDGTTFTLRMAVLDLLLQVADGDDQALRDLYERFKKLNIVH